MAQGFSKFNQKDTGPDLGKGKYETFDSGAGPVVPKGYESDFASRDSDLMADGESADHGDVPEVPQKKR